MRSLKKQLLLLVIVPVILLSVLGSVFSLAYTKDRAILATDNKAKSDLATGEQIIELMYPGPWEVRDGNLYKGQVKISNNFSAVDKIASLTGDTVTIFLGDIRVSTTVREGNGERAIGTRASEPVANSVLKNGQEYLGEANVVGEMYRTAYKPIRDINGKIIGMFYVGIAKNLSDQLIKNSMISMAAITTVLTIIVALGAWFFTQRVIIKPLQEITVGTREMAVGHLHGKINVSSTQEIGELASAFNQMVEAMQNIAVRISKVTGIETAAAPNRPATGIEQVKCSAELPKGLNEVTLNQIIAYIHGNEKTMSAEEVGEGVNITRVTARRYLEYLEKTGQVSVEQKYGTVGRPVKLYKKIS